MMNVLIAAVITLCVNFGVRQRYMPFVSVITPRQKRTLYVSYAILAAVNMAVLTAALYIWGVVFAFNYLRFGGIIYAVVLSLVNMLVIPGRTREHLFVFGAVLTCNYLLLSIPNFLLHILKPADINGNLFVVLTTYVAVLLLSHLPLGNLLRKTVEPLLDLVEGEYWNTIWYIPIILCTVKFFNLGGEHNEGNVYQLISSMIYIGIIVLLCVSIIADCQRVREHKIMETQLADQKLHYAELKIRVDDARKTKHDFMHHIAVIRHYIDMDDKLGLIKYCDELTGRMDDRQDRIPYTGNAAVDGVIYHFIQRARENQIQFDYSGVIHSSGIADVDLCALLGNALENAMAACLTIPERRSVKIISQSEKQLLSIVVHNSFDGIVRQSEKGLLSRKREDSTGVGMSSMRSICERYHGDMEVRWDEHNFTVIFILPLPD